MDNLGSSLAYEKTALPSVSHLFFVYDNGLPAGTICSA